MKTKTAKQRKSDRLMEALDSLAERALDVEENEIKIPLEHNYNLIVDFINETLK